MKITESDAFKKEFKRLSKKYRTLEKDFEVLKSTILVEPKGDGSKHWNLLKQDGDKSVFKIRMMCRALRSSSFRVVYVFGGSSIEVLFIEIYFKGDKENEDWERIAQYFKNIS